MKNLIAYKTDVQLTANIVEAFSSSINKYIKGSNSKVLHINEFLQNGIPKNVDGIITLGILRGTGIYSKKLPRKILKDIILTMLTLTPAMMAIAG